MQDLPVLDPVGPHQEEVAGLHLGGEITQEADAFRLGEVADGPAEKQKETRSFRYRQRVKASRIVADEQLHRHFGMAPP